MTSWSTEQYRQRVDRWLDFHIGFCISLLLLNTRVSAATFTAFMKPAQLLFPKMVGDMKVNKEETAGLLPVFAVIFLPVPSELRQCWESEMKDRRLTALRDAVAVEGPRLKHESYRDTMLPKRALRRPGFCETFSSVSKGNEWQKLRYAASVFIEEPTSKTTK